MTTTETGTTTGAEVTGNTGTGSATGGEAANKLPTTNAGWLELGNEFLLRHPLRTSSIVPERGDGIYMWDVEGKRYVDFQSGQLCVTLGHSHPEYVRALVDQANKIMQTGTTFVVPSEVLLAQKIG